MKKTKLELTQDELRQLSTVLFLHGTGRAGDQDTEKFARKINERVQRRMNQFSKEATSGK